MIGWLLAAPALVAAAITGVNLVTWPALRRKGPIDARVSVLIPARNEERTIGRAVKAALADPAVLEVVVADDGSTDATPQVLKALAVEHPRLRVIRPGPLPAGWIGKPHACHALGEAAQGDVLLFVDADVRLEADGVGRILAALRRHRADVLTAVPRQVLGSAAEALLLPLLYVTYTSWLPNALVPLTSDPRVLAANGQVLAISRGGWRRVGGFAAVRGEIVDDMALCRRAKEAGLRVVFADGRRAARCRMYGDLPSIVAGFSKNLYEGLGSGPAVVAALALYVAAFVLPYALLVASAAVPELAAPAIAAVAANLGLRAALALRFGHAAWSVLAHPIAVLGLVGIAVNSWRWHARGAVAWRGRTYAARGDRRTA